MKDTELSLPELIEALAHEIGVNNVDANLITQQKIEAVFKGLNEKSLEQIEAFFK